MYSIAEESSTKTYTHWNFNLILLSYINEISVLSCDPYII